MSTMSDKIEGLFSSVSDLAETKAEIFKLKAAGKISASLSSLIAITIAIIFGSVTLTVISFGFAYLIGSELDNLSYGFFIIGGFYILAGILVYANRKKWVIAPLSNLFIDKFVK